MRLVRHIADAAEEAASDGVLWAADWNKALRMPIFKDSLCLTGYSSRSIASSRPSYKHTTWVNAPACGVKHQRFSLCNRKHCSGHCLKLHNEKRWCFTPQAGALTHVVCLYDGREEARDHKGCPIQRGSSLNIGVRRALFQSAAQSTPSEAAPSAASAMWRTDLKVLRLSLA